MARALVWTALTQVAVAVVALMAGLGSTGSNWPEDIVIFTGLFVTLWLGAAWLFRRAAREPSPEVTGPAG